MDLDATGWVVLGPRNRLVNTHEHKNNSILIRQAIIWACSVSTLSGCLLEREREGDQGMTSSFEVLLFVRNVATHHRQRVRDIFLLDTFDGPDLSMCLKPRPSRLQQQAARAEQQRAERQSQLGMHCTKLRAASNCCPAETVVQRPTNAVRKRLVFPRMSAAICCLHTYIHYIYICIYIYTYAFAYTHTYIYFYLYLYLQMTVALGSTVVLTAGCKQQV